MSLRVNVVKEITRVEGTIYNEITTVKYNDVNGITYEEIEGETYFVIWHHDNERSSFNCKSNYITFE